MSQTHGGYYGYENGGVGYAIGKPDERRFQYAYWVGMKEGDGDSVEHPKGEPCFSGDKVQLWGNEVTKTLPDVCDSIQTKRD